MRRAVSPSVLSVAIACALSVSAQSDAQVCPECVDAVVVEVGSTPFAGSPTGCVLPAEKGNCGLPSNNTIFFSFTPKASGLYRISTCIGASGDLLTVLSVWGDCSGFSFIECGIAGCPGGSAQGSQIGAIQLEGGFNYRISIGAPAGEGDFIESGVLTIDAIDSAGSGCGSATKATVGANAYDTTALNEIVDLGGFCDPAPSGEPWDTRIYNTQYFTFTPPKSGLYTISTCEQGEQIWERIAVLAGCETANGVVACSDSNCYSETDYSGSRITAVSLDAGTEYIILIGGVLPSQAGAGVFTIAPFEPCPAPKATVLELEPCGGNGNSTCGAAAEPISLGDTVRGTVWAANGSRDVDWYRIELAEGTELTLELNSSVPGFATIFFGNCTTSLFMDQTSGVCPGLTDGECLPAGTYYLVVAPYDFFGFPCGFPGGNEYSLTVTGRPCDASPPPNDLCVDALPLAEGATPFDNYFAGTDVEFETCALIGRDVWFTFTAKQGGTHKFSVCNGVVAFNSGMDVWTACPDLGGEVIACNRDAGPECGDSSFSTIVLPMTAGQTVLIRVGSEWLFDILPPGEAELVVSFIGSDIVCGAPDAGSCCTARETPFCSDIACCNTICIFDPPCCDAAWDETCAAAAPIWCYSECGLPPGNDECSNAGIAVIGANDFRNTQATGSTSTPCGVLRYDVWYLYESRSAEPVTISFCESDGGWALITGGNLGALDTRIAIIDGCNGTLIACNDDGDACDTSARLTFDAECGALYLIGIGSNPIEDGIYGQGVGSFVISQAGNCGADCPADLSGDGVVNGSDLTVLLGAWGTGNADADLNGDGSVNGSDLTALLGAWGACAP